MAKRSKKPTYDPTPLAGPLAVAAEKSPGGGKPPALDAKNRAAKKNYAQYLSNELATMFAAHVRPHYANARVTPHEDGRGQEFSVGAAVDKKRTDVGVWDDAAGLILGLSIKTYTFRDYHQPKKGPAYLGRYVRNIKRNDMELRDEADTLHRRQPYSVLAAVVFMPEDAAYDAGSANGHSSFAHAVFTFRKRTGRSSADHSRNDLFEKVYIGLFAEDGSVRFFDVAAAPPRNQSPHPSATISLDELLNDLYAQVELRNTGSLPGERYAADDPAWTMPTLLGAEVHVEDGTLKFEDALADLDDLDDLDDPEGDEA